MEFTVVDTMHIVTTALHSADPDTHLDTRACLQFAQTADERPTAGGDVGDFGDGLHPLGTSNAHLQQRTQTA